MNLPRRCTWAVQKPIQPTAQMSWSFLELLWAMSPVEVLRGLAKSISGTLQILKAITSKSLALGLGENPFLSGLKPIRPSALSSAIRGTKVDVLDSPLFFLHWIRECLSFQTGIEKILKLMKMAGSM